MRSLGPVAGSVEVGGGGVTQFGGESVLGVVDGALVEVGTQGCVVAGEGGEDGGSVVVDADVGGGGLVVVAEDGGGGSVVDGTGKLDEVEDALGVDVVVDPGSVEVVATSDVEVVDDGRLVVVLPSGIVVVVVDVVASVVVVGVVSGLYSTL